MRLAKIIVIALTLFLFISTVSADESTISKEFALSKLKNLGKICEKDEDCGEAYCRDECFFDTFKCKETESGIKVCTLERINCCAEGKECRGSSYSDGCVPKIGARCSSQEECGEPECVDSCLLISRECKYGEDKEVKRCVDKITDCCAEGGFCKNTEFGIGSCVKQSCEKDEECGKTKCENECVKIKPVCKNSEKGSGCTVEREDCCAEGKFCEESSFGAYCKLKAKRCSDDKDCGKKPECEGNIRITYKCVGGECVREEYNCLVEENQICRDGKCVNCVSDYDCGKRRCVSSYTLISPECIEGLCNIKEYKCLGECVEPLGGGAFCTGLEELVGESFECEKDDDCKNKCIGNTAFYYECINKRCKIIEEIDCTEEGLVCKDGECISTSGLSEWQTSCKTDADCGEPKCSENGCIAYNFKCRFDEASGSTSCVTQKENCCVKNSHCEIKTKRELNTSSNKYVTIKTAICVPNKENQETALERINKKFKERETMFIPPELSDTFDNFVNNYFEKKDDGTIAVEVRVPSWEEKKEGLYWIYIGKETMSLMFYSYPNIPAPVGVNGVDFDQEIAEDLAKKIIEEDYIGAFAVFNKGVKSGKIKITKPFFPNRKKTVEDVVTDVTIDIINNVGSIVTPPTLHLDDESKTAQSSAGGILIAPINTATNVVENALNNLGIQTQEEQTQEEKKKGGEQNIDVLLFGNWWGI